MQSTQLLKAITDDELLHRLAALLQSSRHTEADLVAHIGEVDARRLYAREASPSMWSYCTERLHLSGAEAYLRIAAARASREHPAILEMLADGRLHLTAIALLAPHLTPENRESLLQRATYKSKREIEELLAELEPRPDAPARIRKLPERRNSAGAGSPWSAVLPSAAPPPDTRPSLLTPPVPPGHEIEAGHEAEAAHAPESSSPPVPELRLDEVVSNRSAGTGARPAVIEPLSPSRYKVQFTASAQLREKLERLRALMRSSVPDGDLAAVIDAAVTEKLERLESRRFGRTRAPQRTIEATDVSPSSRHVPAAVRRGVHERDEGRCRYVDQEGRRCTARVLVQFHHRHPFGLGGDHSPGNLALLCHVHNRYLAEIDYGRAAMARHGRPGAGRPPSTHSAVPGPVRAGPSAG